MPYHERTKTLLCSALLCLGLWACDKPEDKAEEQAAADKLALIQTLIVLPEKMPKDLKQACNDVATAQDEFMMRNFEGEALEKWNAAKGTQLGMVKNNCAKAQSMEVPACQIHAMNSAPPELKKDLPELLKGCIDKFGPGGSAAAAGAPPAQ